MSSIPVLEYEQQAGRAGRPGKDPWGEALCIAKDEKEAGKIVEQYLNGSPEEIYSKLAVEPVLRTYVLSLVASDYVQSREALYAFFAKTFYAHQYGDSSKLRRILDRMVGQLREWGFLNESGMQNPAGGDGFSSAADLLDDSVQSSDEQLSATLLGRRVSELYLDPYTAFHIIKGLRRSTAKPRSVFALLHLLASCLEMRPFIKAKAADLESVEEKMALEERSFLHLAPTRYSEEYDEFLDTVKTAMLFEGWVGEADEESLLESFGVRPGELHAKLENADWLAYSAGELARLLSLHQVRGDLLKLRTRLKHGAREELLQLLKLREVGRVRARKLFGNGIRDVAGLQQADVSILAQLVGRAVAVKLKEQVGQKVAEEDVAVKPHKRKGQVSLADWG